MPLFVNAFGNHADDRVWRYRIERMTIQRMENVGIVVDDLAAATAFFIEIGPQNAAQQSDANGRGGSQPR